MGAQAEIGPQYEGLLHREVIGQVHFSDVISEVAGEEEGWWRETDFDAWLTIKAKPKVRPLLGHKLSRYIPFSSANCTALL